jgi:curli biogenesis system outer membrane secretion channel CsgG
MKRLRRHSVMAVLLLLTASLRVEAQGKIKIAIWEFENHTEHRYWFSNDLGPAARDQIDTEFSENSTLSSKFSVIERDKLSLVLKEQGLGASGAVDPTTAAKVGKILGVKYILIGGIDKFSIDNTKGAVGALGVGGNLVQSSATINMRMIDTTTAERLVSISSDGEVKKGGGFFKGTSLSRDAEWGIASETVKKVSKAVVAKFVGGGYLDRLSGTMTVTQNEGKVIKVDGAKAWINLGANAGIKMGDKFNIFNVGEALIDPDSGRKLGADEKQTGNGTVTEVQSEYAVMTLSGTGKAKDTVRKQ